MVYSATRPIDTTVSGIKAILKKRLNRRLYSALSVLNRAVRGASNTGLDAGPRLADLAPLGEPFASALRSMYCHEPQLGLDGHRHELDAITRIPIEVGMFLYRLCRDTNARQTMEIGCAYGFSTLYFLAALSSNRAASHVAIDPYEKSQWCGIGARKVDEVGMGGTFRLFEELSVVAVPRLMGENILFDVIFIDGNHRFDDVLVDFTLSALVCKRGGFIIFDDMWMPSIRKVASFVRRNRADFAEVPAALEYISVFQKIGADERSWRHFEDFD